MQLGLKILFMVIVGGLIGWMTNVIAIKLLFRPLRPVKLPFGMEIVGLIPKRRFDIAKNIGETVHNDLVTMDDIGQRLLTDENKQWLFEEIKGKLATVVDEKLNRFPAGIKLMVMGMAGDIIDKEVGIFIEEKSEELVEKAKANVNIGEIVEEKINQFELEKIEDIILQVAKTELKHIEVLGGFLGAAIGLVQAVIMQFIW